MSDQAVASKQLSAIATGICGGVAGAVSRLVASPLDVVKIRLQLQTGRPSFGFAATQLSQQKILDRKYNGMLHAVSMIIREEGIRGLWKGNLSAEYLYLSYGTVQFLTYQQMQILFSSIGDGRDDKLIFNKTLQPFLSGAVCGATATVTTYPFDLLRTRFAAQGEKKIYSGLTHAIKQIYNQEGIGGFYRGISASVLQIIPYMGLMFGSYEISKKSFRLLEEKSFWFSNLRGAEDFLSGAIAGMIGKTGIFPLDLLRRRLQLQGPSRSKYVIKNIPSYSNSIYSCIRQIIVDEGFLGLYKGLTPALLKAAPVSATTFFVYGQTKKLLEKLHGIS
ncbi:20184_t:CDS:2 [Gigaspora margarita]|uniref:20184_t:CDS:1 n=1 Tax=Gigaspora margarita TaxID=4874 RepID=A0ABN7UWY8_GIGMA|nr:20184_t:CDS:2 [Gigaspora margarita]